MANEEHLAILKQGVHAWHKWRKEHSGTRPDLSDSQLSLVDLHGLDLNGAQLPLADLHEADLNRVLLLLHQPLHEGQALLRPPL